MVFFALDKIFPFDSSLPGYNFLSILLGLFLYYLILWFFYLCMKCCFKCEIASLHDQSFLLDNTTNIHNVMGVATFDKFEYEPMIKYFSDKTKGMHKARARLVKKLGLWWYKSMSDQEWENEARKVFPLKEGIHDEQALHKFATDEQTIDDLENMPQYKFYLIPDFTPERSAIVMKMHHNFADGQGMSTLFHAFSDSYNPDNLMNLK